jgi:hypothetical protein
MSFIRMTGDLAKEFSHCMRVNNTDAICDIRRVNRIADAINGSERGYQLLPEYFILSLKNHL